MKNTSTEHDRDLALENFAAELTEAAYPVILRQRPKGSWLDLELDLWKVIGNTVKTSKGSLPCT
jgi:hypothetical protein